MDTPKYSHTLFNALGALKSIVHSYVEVRNITDICNIYSLIARTPGFAHGVAKGFKKINYFKLLDPLINNEHA